MTSRPFFWLKRRICLATFSKSGHMKSKSEHIVRKYQIALEFPRLTTIVSHFLLTGAEQAPPDPMHAEFGVTPKSARVIFARRGCGSVTGSFESIPTNRSILLIGRKTRLTVSGWENRLKQWMSRVCHKNDGLELLAMSNSLMSCIGMGLVLATAALAANLGGNRSLVVSSPQDVQRVDDGASGPYDWDRIGQVAQDLAATEYFVLPDHGGLSIDEGWLALLGEQSGETLSEGSDLGPGLYWNLSETIVWIQRGKVDRIPLGPGGLFLVASSKNTKGDLLAGLNGTAAPGSLSVICRDGYYACCNLGPPPTAKCYKNSDTNQTCEAGGPGSSSCTVTQ